MTYKLTYWRHHPDEVEWHYERHLIEVVNHNAARKKAKEIYKGHKAGTLINDLCLCIYPPSQFAEMEG